MYLFSSSLVALLCSVLVVSSSFAFSGHSPDCSKVKMLSSACRGEIKAPLVEALRSKMKSKNLSYDCKLEDAALSKLLLDDEWKYLFPDMEITKELTFNETRAKSSPLKELAKEFVMKAIETWSDDLKSVVGTKFGCNFFVMASSLDESDGEEGVMEGEDKYGDASEEEERGKETYDYLLSCLFN
ncbi:hypothetical protein ANCCAN_13931 [Ancylostoma caninum]|uniref:SCP domain-containing protein n=1 Tax=Ancylostoma caninum TaxID=29170 RepID=A0A368GAX2_ANCCA|nr:hypothetical protein ANCCAN_13931 [Ancylostoma caninum]